MKKFVIWYNFINTQGKRKHVYNRCKIIDAINIKIAHLKFFAHSRSESVYIIRTEINEKSGLSL